LKLTNPADQPRAVAVLRDLVSVQVLDADRLGWQTAEAHLLHPVLLNRLLTAGIGVHSLAEQPRRLEDLYLRIVAEDEAVPNPRSR